MLDYEFRASDVALGAAAENIDLAARSLGLHANWGYFPQGYESHCVFQVDLGRGGILDKDELFSQITLRCTNRRKSQWCELPAQHVAALQREANAAGAELRLITDRPSLASVGELIGRVDRLRFFSRPMHNELIQELRWTGQEARMTGDGIDVATLEMTSGEQAVLQLLRSWPTMERLKQLQGGKGIIRATEEIVESSSAVGLLSVPDRGRESYVLGGRVLQRVWLRSSLLGLSLQPMSVLIYLLSRLEDEPVSAFSVEEQAELIDIRTAFSNILGSQMGHTRILLFRLFQADPPTVRSFRREVSSVM
jgi:hypothetical protein